MSCLEDIALELNQDSHDFTFDLAPEGVSGTYFVKKEGKYVAVFKDSSQDPVSSENPRLQAKLQSFFFKFLKYFGFYTAIDHSVQGQSFVSDKVSFLFAQKMKLDNVNVPESIISTIYVGKKTIKGALIAWIPYAKALTKYTNFFGKLNKTPANMDIKAFEEAALFDYVTGNMDRKLGNFLINQDNFQKPILNLIDNSWAFSPIQGEAISFNQYAWGRFPLLADKKFSGGSKLKIASLFAERYEYGRMVFKQYCKENPPEETIEISYQRAISCVHRIEMMHHLINTKDKTFFELSEVCFEDDFLKLNGKDGLNLSPHFIDSATESLAEEGIIHATNHKKTASELRYENLYNPINNGSHGRIYSQLKQEIIRLNKKQAYRNGIGLWRERFKDKANLANEAFEELQNNKSDTAIDEKIKAALEDESSKLYTSLNKHSSFIFKGYKTDAILNMEQAMHSYSHV